MKRIITALFFIVATVIIIKMPDMVQSSIPSIYYVTPSRKTYENVIQCSGTIQSATVGEVYLSSAGQVESIFVEVGDAVTTGELMAKVSPVSLTDSRILPSLQVNGLYSGIDADLASIAALYSLSTGMGGALTDYTDLAQLLSLVQEQQTSEIKSTLADEWQGSVLAPIGGIVTGIAMTQNAYAFPGIPVVTVSANDAFKVLASIPEAEISRVMLGDSAGIRCTGYPKRSYHGTVTRIYPSAHKILSGTVTETVVDIEITLTDSDENLKPGFSATVEISGGNNQILITVPYEAIRQDENNDEYVYVYEGGAIRKAPVLTGQELTNEVEVLAGLSEESVVVYNPSDIVREGQVIQLKGRADVD